MSIFARLFSKKKLTRDDPDFGHLEYGSGVWARIPKTGETRFMVTVIAPESGPADSHRLFFQKLSEAMPNLERAAKESIVSQTRGKVDVSALAIYSIEIGDDTEIATNSFVIELSDEQAHEIHRVELRQNEPDFCGVDD